MNIQYYGDYCFKISTKPAGRATEDVTILTDPLEKGAGLRPPQGQADILFLSHKSEEKAKEDTIVFDAPGEYAVKGIAALGFPTFCDKSEGKERGHNTVFIFESEDIHICYLGSLGHDLSPDLLDKLSGSDILFIPVGAAGDGDTLDAKAAADLVRKIEPSIVIPMHYKIPGLTLSLETEKAFCEAMGNCPSQSLSKLNIKKKDLEGKVAEVVLLERGA